MLILSGFMFGLRVLVDHFDRVSTFQRQLYEGINTFETVLSRSQTVGFESSHNLIVTNYAPFIYKYEYILTDGRSLILFVRQNGE